MIEYTIDITAYDHVSTIKVLADEDDEAIRKACEEKNISVTIRSQRPVAVVS